MGEDVTEAAKRWAKAREELDAAFNAESVAKDAANDAVAARRRAEEAEADARRDLLEAAKRTVL